MGNIERYRAGAIILNSERAGGGSILAFAERKLAGLDSRRRQDRIINAQHTSALAMNIVEEAERRVSPPRLWHGVVLKDAADSLRRRVRSSLEQQGHCASHMRGGHRSAAQVRHAA